MGRMKEHVIEIAEKLRKVYPAGTRLELVHMDDPQVPPAGTRGTVQGVDDMASLLVSWDAGSSLSVLYGVDKVIKVKPACF